MQRCPGVLTASLAEGLDYTGVPKGRWEPEPAPGQMAAAGPVAFLKFGQSVVPVC